MLETTRHRPDRPGGRWQPDETVSVAIVSDASPERNGVGSYYADLRRQLLAGDNRVEFICPRDRSNSWQRYLAPPLPGDRTQKIWLPHPYRLWTRISAAHPDAVIVPTPGPYGIAGMLAARALKIPLIVGFHTHYEALAGLYWNHLLGSVSRQYLKWCNSLLFRHSALVLTNSPDMTRAAGELGAHRTELMGTSVPEPFLSRPLKNLDGPMRSILFVGRLAEEKNIDLVVDVARRLPWLEVSIAGNGPLRADVESAAREIRNLSYLGWVQRADLPGVIDDHDCLLLPSRVESFGTVALEAMARARPVIVSSACGIADWPSLRNALFTIPPGGDVVDSVTRVASMPADERNTMAMAAHCAARELNDWNLVTWIERIRRGHVTDPQH